MKEWKRRPRLLSEVIREPGVAASFCSVLSWALFACCLLSPRSTALSDETERVAIDLPGFEQGDLYVLGRLSNADLVQVEGSEWGYVAILTRNGLDLAHRRQAIVKLAKHRDTDELTQILQLIPRAARDSDEGTDALNDLIGFLMAAPRLELEKKRDHLIQFATNGDHDLVREAGYAAVILADGTVDPAWQVAEKSEADLIALLNGIPLITDRTLRASLYPRVSALLRDASTRGIRRAAMLASASVPGHESNTFSVLASYVHENVERDTAVQALLRLPTEHWLPDRVDDLAQNVLEHLQGADPTERSRPEFRSAHQLGRKLASLLPAEQRRRILNTLNTLGIRFVTIRSVPYSMRYDLVHVVAPAGGAVELKFENPDMWPHNLVIVAPGALEEIGIMASQMVPDSESWKGRRYVPKSDKVLYATRIVETSDSETMTIVAPEVVGEYPFLCTYPGHWVSMNGILHVVEDVDAWIAENPVKATGSDPDARAFVQAWKLEDLSDDLIKLEGRRSLERGKALFTVASCVACRCALCIPAAPYAMYVVFSS